MYTYKCCKELEIEVSGSSLYDAIAIAEGDFIDLLKTMKDARRLLWVAAYTLDDEIHMYLQMVKKSDEDYPKYKCSFYISTTTPISFCETEFIKMQELRQGSHRPFCQLRQLYLRNYNCDYSMYVDTWDICKGDSITVDYINKWNNIEAPDDDDVHTEASIYWTRELEGVEN